MVAARIVEICGTSCPARVYAAIRWIIGLVMWTLRSRQSRVLEVVAFLTS
jgi:hypothetical protein